MTRQATELRFLLLFTVQTLVDDPVSISIQAEEDGGIILLKLRVAESDLGKLIGSHGRTARSMRTVLVGAAMKSEVKCRLEILQ